MPAGATPAASISTTCCRCRTPRKPSKLLARQVGEAQDFLGVQLLIENVSAYVAFEHSRLAEWEFLAAVAARSGCALLLDVNNIYVSAQNLGHRSTALHRFAAGRAACARSTWPATRATAALLIDDHGSQVCEPVWELYAPRHRALRRIADAGRMGHATFRRSRRWLPRRGAPSRFSGRCMASLRELQRSFAAALRDPAAACAVLPPANLAVYRNNAHSTFRAALELTYPVVRRRVGDDYFRQLCAHYRERFPSRSGDLHWAGRDFAGIPRRVISPAATTPGSPISRVSSGRAPNAWSRASQPRWASKRSGNPHPRRSNTWCSGCSHRCGCSLRVSRCSPSG